MSGQTTENGADKMLDLKSKKALVTGSSQGMGKEIAKMLSDAGATVHAHGSHMSDKLAEAAKYIGTDKIAVADLYDNDAATRLYEVTGGVDILILNASVQYKRDWDEFSDEELDRQIVINIKSTYQMMKTFAPYMKEKKWGRIINIGSVNQYNNHPQLLIYGVTKAADMKLVEGVAKSLAPFGITVNNIAPGAINTPRNSEALSDADFLKKVEASIPAGYVGDAMAINGAVALLCEEKSYITGSEIIADGGMHL